MFLYGRAHFLFNILFLYMFILLQLIHILLLPDTEKNMHFCSREAE